MTSTLEFAGVQRQAARLVLWLRPDGWQTRARRNAWASMVGDHQRRMERAEVERALHPLALPTSVARVQVR